MARPDLDSIDVRFNYHQPPDQDTVNRHQTVRDSCRTAALAVEAYVPDGREKALALTKLEEAMMWANAGIARKISARADEL